MAKHTDLTMEAIKGYQGESGNPYLYSSPAWYAYQLGAYLQRTGRTLPRDVRMGRGYQVHANDCLWAFDGKDQITRVR